MVQTASPYSPGKYVNLEFEFFNGDSYGNSSRSPVRPYKNCTVKSGMSIDSHPESCVLVQTASPCSPAKYVNWNLSFSMEILYIRLW